MKEIQDIGTVYSSYLRQGIKAALATVVHLEGSAYRRPGARMLISEEGQLTGAISGGCLEGDALRKARLAMVQNKPMLVKYDTMDDDDSKLGVGLGCNGIIHILIEPIDPSQPHHPVALLQQLIGTREKAVVVTLFTLGNRHAVQPGTCLLAQQNAAFPVTSNVPQELVPLLYPSVQEALCTEVSRTITVGEGENSYTAFIEVVVPSIALVICGAGNDVMPLVEMASHLGWPSSVIDGRPNYATPDRFPTAQQVLVSTPDKVLSKISVDHYTAFLMLTHNFNYDMAMLKVLLPLHLPYIGVLGPKNKRKRLLQDLREEGFALEEEMLHSLYGPVGLDIGAETPEEIALSILAEIKTVFSNRAGGFLREKELSIHTGSPGPHGDGVLLNKEF